MQKTTPVVVYVNNEHVGEGELAYLRRVEPNDLHLDSSANAKLNNSLVFKESERGEKNDNKKEVRRWR